MMDTDKAKLYHAVSMWINYVETDSATGIPRDQIIELAKTDKDMQRIARNLPHLTVEQLSFLASLRDLQSRILSGNLNL